VHDVLLLVTPAILIQGTQYHGIVNHYNPTSGLTRQLSL
jgi:hypothetical protein